MPYPLPPPETIQQQVAVALAEDIGSGDVTAQLIAEDTMTTATVISREQAIICGCPWVAAVFQQLDPTIKIEWSVEDGNSVSPQQRLCTITGPARTILSGERTALNFLQTLSATATQTHAYVDAIKDTSCHILDTRKTIPGLRLAQKYAVLCGGGVNHRNGLYDMVLIKENHIHAAGSIAAAVQTARQQATGLKVEVEVENLDELQQALDAGVDRILLDNMDISTLEKAVAITSGKTQLEASGGVDLQSVKQIAETGVDFISIGSISKNIAAIDLSMRFE